MSYGPIAQRRDATTESPSAEATLRRIAGAYPRALILVVILAAGLGVYLRGAGAYQVGSIVDDAHYVITARAMATGDGYSLISYPDDRPEAKYPPLYPLLLTPLAAVSGGSLQVFRVPSLLLTLGALLIWFRYLRRWWSFPVAAILLAAVATNPLIAETSTEVLSEPPFLFLFVVLLVLAERWLTAARGRLTPRQYVVLALLLAALTLTRLIGVAFGVALAMYMVRKWRLRDAAVVTLVQAVVLAAWAFRNHRATGALLSAGYEAELQEGLSPATTAVHPNLLTQYAERALHNLSYYATVGIPEALGLDFRGVSRNPEAAPTLLWVVAAVDVVLLVIIGLGFIRRGRRLEFPEIAAVCLMGVLMVWSGTSSRLIYPLIPLLYLFVYEGVLAACAPLQAKAAAWAGHMRRALPVLAMGGLVMMNAALVVWPSPPRDPPVVFDGAAWVAEHTPPNSIVMTEWSEARYLYTRRESVDLPPRGISDPQGAAAVDRLGVNYVLLLPQLSVSLGLDPDAEATRQWLLAHPERYGVVYADPTRNVTIFQVR